MAQTVAIKKSDIIEPDADGYTVEPLLLTDDINSPAELIYTDEDEMVKMLRMQKLVNQQVYYFEPSKLKTFGHV